MCKHMFYSSETLPCMCLKEVKDETPLEQTHAAPDHWSHRKDEVNGSMAVAYRIRLIRKNSLPPLQGVVVRAYTYRYELGQSEDCISHRFYTYNRKKFHPNIYLYL